MDDGVIAKAKKMYTKVMGKLSDRKDYNAQIKRLRSAIEKIIMGEGEFNDSQTTLDDFIDQDEPTE